MSETTVRTYGGWRVARAAGVGRFTLGETMLLMGIAIMVVVVNMAAGMAWAALTLALGGGTALLMSMRDKHGMNAFARVAERRSFARARRRRTNLWRGGALTPRKASSGRLALPGILGRIRVTDQVDSYGRPFALVHHGDGRKTVVMSLSPAGVALMDQEDVDRQVAYWGLWLSDLSDEAGVVDASITVETAPDTGTRLRAEVASRMVDDTPAAARRIVQGVVDSSGARGHQVLTWATVSFDPARMSGAKRGREKRAVKEIETRLAGVTQTLVEAGAGAVHLLTAGDLARLVRVSFDPASETVFNDAHLAGERVDLQMGEAGPLVADAEWDHYRHDSGLSRSWVVSRPPRGNVQSSVLGRILDVSRDVPRKRVTLMYRPMEAAKAPDVVESDVDKAEARRRSAPRPTERMNRDAVQARRTASEEASGASVLSFAMVITATVSATGAGHELEDAAAAVESLAGASRLVVRPAYGAQDAAFALGLPLGVSPATQRLTGGW